MVPGLAGSSAAEASHRWGASTDVAVQRQTENQRTDGHHRGQQHPTPADGRIGIIGLPTDQDGLTGAAGNCRPSTPRTERAR